jgi:predicted DsbA family dithiol-disulfide isomerase
MQITVVGLSCPRIKRTLINAQAAAAEFDEHPEVSWINDLHHIVEIGTKQSPTILINDKVKLSGRIPSVYEITTWIEQELQVALEEEIAA